jgi:calcium-dependent protein kinase
MNSYKVFDKINSGRYGTVYKARYIFDSKNYAIKIVAKNRSHNEVKILTKLQNKHNIVQLKETFEYEDNVYIIEEYCEKGDLNTYLENLETDMTEKEVANLIKQILNGLLLCKNSGIVMCDVKPANILVFDEYKLCDFGCSQYCNDPFTGLTKKIGTPLYLAPEVVKKDYGYLCDVYSIGIMTYFLLTKTYPYVVNIRNLDDILTAITTHNIYLDDAILSPLALNFIEKCLEYDKYKRITFEEALDHLFLKI